MNCRKEIFCQPVQFYLDMFQSNKGNLEKNGFVVKNLCFTL